VESPSLEVFKKHVAMWHFGTWFSRHGGVGLMISEVFSNLNDSMILFYDSKHKRLRLSTDTGYSPQRHQAHHNPSPSLEGGSITQAQKTPKPPENQKASWQAQDKQHQHCWSPAAAAARAAEAGADPWRKR